MAESNNQGGLNPQKVPMERNLLIAFALMGVVMYIQYAFFTPATPPKKSTTPTSQSPSGQTNAQPTAGQTSPPADQTAATNPTPPPTPASASAPPPANATPEKVEPNFILK